MASQFFYVALPYVATALAVVGGIYRYFGDRFSFSSLSSQLVEHRLLFWGVVPWHYGIIPLLLAHLLPLIVPGWWGVLLGGPVRLTVLELTGMALGLSSLAGIVVLILRRLANAKARAVTSVMDWILLALLLLQVALGVHIAFTYRWGSLWSLHTAVPWLRSLTFMRPDPGHVLPMPLAVKIHMANAFLLILLFPFTRLVHIFTFPARYVLRPWQVVWWNRRPGTRKL